jgi:hypothetical protein
MNWDTDNDGYSDKEEVDGGSNPNEISDVPAEKEEQDQFDFIFYILLIIFIVIIILLLFMLIQKEKVIREQDIDTLSEIEEKLQQARELGLPESEIRKALSEAEELRGGEDQEDIDEMMEE